MGSFFCSVFVEGLRLWGFGLVFEVEDKGVLECRDLGLRGFYSVAVCMPSEGLRRPLFCENLKQPSLNPKSPL